MDHLLLFLNVIGFDVLINCGYFDEEEDEHYGCLEEDENCGCFDGERYLFRERMRYVWIYEYV